MPVYYFDALNTRQVLDDYPFMLGVTLVAMASQISDKEVTGHCISNRHRAFDTILGL